MREKRGGQCLVKALDELGDLVLPEPFAERRVPADVRKQDGNRDNRAALGRTLDAAGADVRILPRGRIPNGFQH